MCLTNFVFEQLTFKSADKELNDIVLTKRKENHGNTVHTREESILYNRGP